MNKKEKIMIQQTILKNKYYRTGRIILISMVSLTLVSCSSLINSLYTPHVNVSVKGSYPSREEDESLVIYKNRHDIPIESETIGTLTVICNSNAWIDNCDSVSVFSLAEMKIKEKGGNALLITEFEKAKRGLQGILDNSIHNTSVSSLKGDVLLVSDFSSPPDTVLHNTNFEAYAGLGFGPETGISLPKFGIYNFQDRKYFETYYGAEVGIWGLVVWWMSLDCLYGIKKSIFTFDTSIGAWWMPSQFKDGAGHYFQTTLNPKIGFKFREVWLKAGPSVHLYRSDSREINIGKIGGMYYNFEILIKF